MSRGLAAALLCSFAVAGQVHAQEVIVARETKPDASKQATKSPEPTRSESAAPAQTKPKLREKRPASAVPTLEQMRMAGALAAERLNQSLSQGSTPARSDPEGATAGPPAAATGTASPPRKETRAEQASVSRPARSRTTKSTKPEAIAPVRPTMMESGRQEPAASPPAKAQAGGEQTPPP
jgi:hypothetical protein